MNYKKYSNNAYNLHIITTDKFKTTMIKINFKNKVKEIDATYRNLLTKVLMQSNQNYPSKKDLEIAVEDLYNLSVSASNFISGNYIITSFNTMFLNEKYTENGMNEKSIEFILDLIFKPNIKNNEFAYFDLAKRLVSDEIETMKDDPKSYANRRLLEEMGKDTILSYNPIGSADILNDITNDNLINYYKNLLKSDLIDIFIIGDVDYENIKKLISAKLKINTVKKNSSSHFYEHKNIRKRAKTIKECKDLEQSKLCLGFKLNNLTDFEKKYVIGVYTFILGGGPDSKLFKNVREKHSLCYNISCTHKPVNNTMVINAGINKNDFKKCLNLIKKEISKMSKADFLDADLEAAKITYINSLKDIEDNQPSLLKIFESNEYLGFDLLDERSKNIKNVEKQDIVNFSKKIILDTVYFLEGDKSEEN